MNEKEEIIETKPSNKVKYTIAIVSSTLVLAAVTTLLIGHFKFDWFKSDNYKLDANISRTVYQANYFSEKKTVSIKFSFANGVSHQKEYFLDTNFVVFLTDREELENKEFLNTAALILLDSKMTYEDGKKDLPHLDIFDEDQLKELEANPEGSQYPIALFKFYEDGKIEEIKFPNNMDEYHAETIIELIEKVIPKLSRNRAEDMSNGLDINLKKIQNKKYIVQKEPPKQFYSFRGSKVSKSVKTEIEDEQIKNIETNSNVQLHSQPAEGEIIFGPKDFYYDIKSDITSKEIKYEQKEKVELVKKIAENFNFIDSKVLLKAIKDKKDEENKPMEISEEKTQPSLRNLGFEVSAERYFDIVSFDVCGQTVAIKYYVKVSKEKAINKIIISSGLGKIEFGNEGCAGIFGKKWEYKQPIFVFPFPNFPVVSVGAYAEGSLEANVWLKYFSGSTVCISLKGKLAMGAEIKAGWDAIASLSAGAEGTVVEADATVTITEGSVSKDSGFTLKMGGLEAYIKGCLFSADIEVATFTIFEGWKYVN
jgi:hypothetical protein